MSTFKKGQEVTFFQSWDNKGTVSFQHAVVYSCGKKQMVLTDAITGNEMGRHYVPTPGYRPHDYRGYTFSRMTDEGAENVAREIAVKILAEEEVRFLRCLSDPRASEGYLKAIRTDMAKLHEPRAINRTGSK